MNGKADGRKTKEEERDQLTGILKKSTAEARIASRMRGRRGGTLFLCDVDQLAWINKQYGHLAGDECLKQAAQLLSYMIGPNDILGRCGEDEFVIFMQDCQDAGRAQEIGRRIRNRFRMNKGKDKEGIPFSVTIVWALYNPGDTCRQLFERADEEMERQKAALERTAGESGKEKDHYIKDVRQVQKELMEQIRKPGAYCRDYKTFKSIYRFLERGIIRSGQKACVILITVVNEKGGSPQFHEKDLLMEELGEHIETTLRVGDVYTRYSSSQFLLLVIGTTEGQADVIVDRIRLQFLAGRQGNDVLIHHCYELKPARIGRGISARQH